MEGIRGAPLALVAAWLLLASGPLQAAGEGRGVRAADDVSFTGASGPAVAVAGEPFTVSATLQSTFGRQVSVGTALYSASPEDGGVLLASQNVTVAPSGTAPVAFTVSMPGFPATAHNLTLVADPAGALAESDEGNNRATVPLRLLANYSDVMVVFNNNSALSKTVAAYFSSARRVPASNLCNTTAPVVETINRAQFGALRAQVADCLNRSIYPIRYIVTTKDVPLRVSDAAWSFASVDSELTLVNGPYEGYIGNDGYFPNPYYGKREEFNRTKFGFIPVTRLTAYNLSGVLPLVDRALNATPAPGLFLLDTDPTKDGGGYQIGNDWLRGANRTLAQRGFDTYLDTNRTFVCGFAGLMGYSSWGSNDANNTPCAAPANTHPGFSFRDGAIAETFVSTSGRTFTWPPSYGQSLIADLIDEGVTGMKGYVFEPFLDAIAEPDILFDRYTRGYTLAESYYAASVKLGWQDVVVGDPKLAPYALLPDPAVASVKLSRSPAPEGQAVRVTVAVRNGGGAAASGVVVSLYNGNPDTGGALLGAPASPGTIAPGGAVQAVFNLSLQVGVYTLYAQINHTSFPEMDGENNRASAILTVNRPADLSVSVTPTPASPLAGETVRLAVRVENGGDFGAAARLNFNRPVNGPAVSLWVPAGGANATTFNYTPAGPGWQNITVDVSSDEFEMDTSSNRASVALFMREYNLTLASDSVERSVPWKAGGGASFMLRVGNSGNTADKYRLDVEHLSGASGMWSWAVPEEPLSLPAGGSATVILSASLNYGGSLRAESGGAFLELRVTATSAAMPALSAATVLRAVLATDRNISVAQYGDPPVLLPGGDAPFAVTVSNRGNVAQSVALNITADREGVEVSLTRTNLTLQPQAEEVVEGTALLTGNPGAGTVVNLTITASGSGGAAALVIPAEVDKLGGVRLTAEAYDMRVSPAVSQSAPGESAFTWNLTLANTGNYIDTYSLAASPAAAAGMAIGISHTVTVPPGTARTVPVVVTLRDGVARGLHHITVTVTVDGGQRAAARLNLTVLLPDIAIRGVPFPASAPVAGKRAEIVVNITNMGDGAAPEGTVHLSVDGGGVATVGRPPLPPGGNATVRLNWTPVKGLWTLTVNTSAAAFESDTDNQMRSFTVAVGGAGAAPVAGGGSGWVASAGVAVVAAAAAIVLMMHLWRRRTTRGPPIP